VGGLAVVGLERELVVANDLLGHSGYFGDCCWVGKLMTENSGGIGLIEGD
jgi:hypothetical protein